MDWNELEWLANGFYTASVILAARNNLYTWLTGIIGCVLLALVFFNARLYGDMTLKMIFLVTNVIGWWQWRHGHHGEELPITRAKPRNLILYVLPAVGITAVYGALLHNFTDAYAPFWDSAVLGFSLLAQFLLLRRKLETWWVWLLVNLLVIPLYISRDLNVTAVVYTGYLLNAGYGWWYWHKLMARQQVQSA